MVALTAAASARDRQDCRDAGIDDYLTKLTDVAALRCALQRQLPAPDG